jgi:type IV pilus assembly protein PilV
MNSADQRVQTQGVKVHRPMRLSVTPSGSRAQPGFAMLEVLASLLVASVGVVALAGLQSRAASVELEANQRAQALVLLQDMSERLSANRRNASAYVLADAPDLGTPDPSGIDCATLEGDRALQDRCEWSARLRGAGVSQGARNVGAMIGARGCIASPQASSYVITVVWQGDRPSAIPASVCGQGAYGDESMRRAVSTMVQVADLEAP